MICYAILYMQVLEEEPKGPLGIRNTGHRLSVHTCGVRPTIQEAEAYRAFVCKEDGLPPNNVSVVQYVAPDE